MPAIEAPADWAPLAEFVAVGRVRAGRARSSRCRTGEQYTEMLTQWATAVDSFETTVRRISELAGLVYFEVEERHFRGGSVNVVNSMTVFEFDDDGKIRHLDVYLQQAR